MATNHTNPTHTPGTVKGTTRVTTTELRPGMTIRFPGRKGQGRAARLATIAAVTSELRAGAYGGKRARWYVTSFTDGTFADFAPATRHDVVADADGAPAFASTDEVPAGPVAAADEVPTYTLTLVSEPGRLF